MSKTCISQDASRSGEDSTRTTPYSSILLDLPAEIRYQIFYFLLVYHGPIAVFGSRRIRTRVDAAILSTNKQLHHEASAVLYGQNSFNLDTSETSDEGAPAAFLHSIGTRNAGLIRHICITFPHHYARDPDTARWHALRDCDVLTLDVVREVCTGLRTLASARQTANVAEWEVGLQHIPWEDADEILGKIDRHFRTVPDLEEVVVWMTARPPSTRIRPLFEGRSWTLKLDWSFETEQTWEHGYISDPDADYSTARSVSPVDPDPEDYLEDQTLDWFD
ncbi:uncharacterized protein B0I36DRAFT_406683 [Microdochium trichocladiopsis]|uniref:F-box domain-containing protein n=1 Tax=Microdochium trichocladiopsis TaxID=1682393 RepID=A0A9P8YA83_9PEZI|nr:uncharacterized protein B0I36DRAFT_406683 [Microdochium trichocladiopsis]KAH7035929.1 hypothetical protein B0I36DRAFT_406683 [Microdochium trichocladiopsis]